MRNKQHPQLLVARCPLVHLVLLCFTTAQDRHPQLVARVSLNIVLQHSRCPKKHVSIPPLTREIREQDSQHRPVEVKIWRLHLTRSGPGPDVPGRDRGLRNRGYYCHSTIGRYIGLLCLNTL